MKKNLAIFFSGLLFSVGLAIAGMTDANKVIAFLNLAGEWDPSLAFVMIGAIGIHLLLFRIILRRPSPIFHDIFHLPTTQVIDVRLIIGSALFGIGWALGGFCPGPALASSITATSINLIFVVSMIVGMIGFHVAKPYLFGES